MNGESGSSEDTIVRVNLNERSYQILIGANSISHAEKIFRDWHDQRLGSSRSLAAFLITDQNVEPIAKRIESTLQTSGWKTDLFSMAPGERSKRLEIVSSAWDRLIEFGADRKTMVIAVGGGVVGDAGGFVAATFTRGLPFLQVPTTLLAAVDSAVGGKVGINHPQAKNMIGAFHQPLGVLIDTTTFESLPDREYRAGLAEVVKYGVILDEAFFDFLEQNVSQLNDRDAVALRKAIARSCELKAYVVENDEYETKGLRAVLNYGHTYAHAFEALLGYGELLHGEAVSIGMVYASKLAEKCGRIDAATTQRQVELLNALRLPTQLPENAAISVAEIMSRMKLDKKTVAGQLRFVLPTRIGHVELVNDVPESLVEATLLESGLQ